MPSSEFITGHTVGVQEQTKTIGKAAGRSIDWSTTRNLDCKVRSLTASEIHEFGNKKGYRSTHIIYCAADPVVDERNQFVFEGKTLQFRGLAHPDATASDMEWWEIHVEFVSTRPGNT